MPYDMTRAILIKLLCYETIQIFVNIIEPVSEAFSAFNWFRLEHDPELK